MHHSPRRRTARLGTTTLAALAATTLAVGTVTAGTGSTAAAAPTAHAGSTTTDPAAAAAGYLARHLQGKHHDHYRYPGTSYVDYGTTADAVLSMDAAGVAQAAATRATAYLAAHAKDYAAAKPTYYPGSSAKLLLVALAQHRNVHDFGGVDLVRAIADSEGAGGAEAGEYQQNPGFSGDSYLVSQALPVLALALTPNAPGQPTTAAVSFLAHQQCANGSFPSKIRTDPTKRCADHDVDSTGYAVQALLAAGDKTAAGRALRWLRAARNDNGGFGAPRSNANSTALAVQALLAGHRKATSGIRWLRHHQVRCGGKPSHRGAVTFQKTYDDSALRATAQAAAALAAKPLAWIDRTGAHRAAPRLAC